MFENISDNDRDEKLTLLIEQLSLVEKGLAVEVSNEFNGVHDLVISAEGDRTKFDAVKKIVAGAPKIDKWTVTAFRQPSTDDFTLTYQDMNFTPSEMFFAPVIEGDSLDLIIFVKGISNHNYEEAAYYGLITIDNVLGEYDCVMKVRHYDFRDLNEISDTSSLQHVTALPKFVDDFHAVKPKQ